MLRLESRERFLDLEQCFNPEEAKRPHHHRTRGLEELTAEIESLRESGDPGHSKGCVRCGPAVATGA